jgi:hypothetical protein
MTVENSPERRSFRFFEVFSHFGAKCDVPGNHHNGADCAQPGSTWQRRCEGPFSGMNYRCYHTVPIRLAAHDRERLIRTVREQLGGEERRREHESAAESVPDPTGRSLFTIYWHQGARCEPGEGGHNDRDCPGPAGTWLHHCDQYDDGVLCFHGELTWLVPEARESILDSLVESVRPPREG